jgi:GNAT superfamily N-acetyltransferase
MSQEPDYRLSLDPADLQLDVVHGFLQRAPWSPGIPRELVARAARNSLVAGVFAPDGSQVGYARLVTDQAAFGWVCDVFVHEDHRRRGLARRMVRALLEHPSARSLRRIMLTTEDAHGVYRPLGFRDPARPEIYMEILRPGNYLL